jgi:hypothetical protein
MRSAEQAGLTRAIVRIVVMYSSFPFGTGFSLTRDDSSGKRISDWGLCCKMCPVKGRGAAQKALLSNLLPNPGVGGPRGEAKLVAVASQLESALPWAERVPAR